MAHEYTPIQEQQQQPQIQQQNQHGQIQPQHVTPILTMQPQPIYYQAQQPYHQQPHYNAVTIKQPKNTCVDENDKYTNDRGYSLTFLILGIFTFFPFIVNVIYLRSPVRAARKYALASVILGTLYLLASTITWSIFYGNYMNEQENYYWNSYYNNNNCYNNNNNCYNNNNNIQA